MSHRFKSAAPFAVDGPDGDHDFQEIEESTEWARRTVDVASATEDTAAVNEMHNQVLAKTLFAVDAPDGKHDLEDVEHIVELYVELYSFTRYLAKHSSKPFNTFLLHSNHRKNHEMGREYC
eukprot:511147_1